MPSQGSVRIMEKKSNKDADWGRAAGVSPGPSGGPPCHPGCVRKAAGVTSSQSLEGREGGTSWEGSSQCSGPGWAPGTQRIPGGGGHRDGQRGAGDQACWTPPAGARAAAHTSGHLSGRCWGEAGSRRWIQAAGLVQGRWGWKWWKLPIRRDGRAETEPDEAQGEERKGPEDDEPVVPTRTERVPGKTAEETGREQPRGASVGRGSLGRGRAEEVW